MQLIRLVIYLQVRKGGVVILAVLGVAGLLFYIPDFFDRTRPYGPEGLSLAYSEGIVLDNLGFDFVTTTEPHYIDINYNLHYNRSINNSIAFVIPFDMKRLDDPTDKWEKKEFPDLHTTVVYKNIGNITDASIEHDENNMSFVLKDNLDSKQLATHTIIVPFASNPIDLRLLNFVNSLPRTGEINTGWETLNFTEVRFYVDSTTDKLNVIPSAKLEQFFRKSDNATSHVFVWNVSSNYQAFYLEYQIPEEREMYEELKQAGLILLGIGLSGLVAYVIAYWNRKNRLPVNIAVR